MEATLFILVIVSQILSALNDGDLVTEHILPNGESCFTIAPSTTCITASKSNANWASSVGACQNLGYAPVIVGDAQTQEVLVQIMKRHGFDHLWLPAKMDKNSWFWIGEDEKLLGTYSKWGNGRPRPPAVSDVFDCVMTITYRGFTWEDKACAFFTGFVCEAEAGSKLCQDSSNFDEVVLAADKCLLVSNRRLSFFKARDFCSSAGSRLLRIENEATQRALERVTSWNVSFVGGYWIGLTRARWLWHDGEEVILSFWEASQPSRSNAECARIEKFSSQDYLWANMDCLEEIPYVCETDTPIPSTSPVTTLTTETSSSQPLSIPLLTASYRPATETSTTDLMSSSPSSPSPPTTSTEDVFINIRTKRPTTKKTFNTYTRPPWNRNNETIIRKAKDTGGISTVMTAVSVVLTLTGLMILAVIICCILFIRRVRARRRELMRNYQQQYSNAQMKPSTASHSHSGSVSSSGTDTYKRRYIKNQNSHRGRARLSISSEHKRSADIYHDDDEDEVLGYAGDPAYVGYVDPVYGGYQWPSQGGAYEVGGGAGLEPQYVPPEIARAGVDVLDENPAYLDYVSWTQTPKGTRKKIVRSISKGTHSTRSQGQGSQRNPSTFVNDGFNNNNSVDTNEDKGDVSESDEVFEDLSVVSYSLPNSGDPDFQGSSGQRVEKQPSMKEKYNSLRHAMKHSRKSKGSVGRASIISAPGIIENNYAGNGKRPPWLTAPRTYGQEMGRPELDGVNGVKSNFIWAVPYPGDYDDIGSNWLPNGPVTEL